jgi:hypothetical protein
MSGVSPCSTIVPPIVCHLSRQNSAPKLAHTLLDLLKSTPEDQMADAIKAVIKDQGALVGVPFGNQTWLAAQFPVN